MNTKKNYVQLHILLSYTRDAFFILSLSLLIFKVMKFYLPLNIHIKIPRTRGAVFLSFMRDGFFRH